MQVRHGVTRFIHKTRGVCPPEIHFEVKDGVLREVSFVGGGCPGNAELVRRLLRGRPIDEVLQTTRGIPCRGETSCPDQLASALRAVACGDLEPAQAFRVSEELEPKRRLGLIGELDGRRDVLDALVGAMRESGVEAVCLLGNLTGRSQDSEAVLRKVRDEKLWAVAGDRDWAAARGSADADEPGTLSREGIDLARRLPHVLSFRLGHKRAVGFYGGYVLDLPGVSDFAPFALEMNMVCNLARYMRDEQVFPALAAMTPQFRVDVVLFSQLGQWRHWEVGGIDFISAAPAYVGGEISWGLLEEHSGGVDFQVRKASLPGVNANGT